SVMGNCPEGRRVVAQVDDVTGLDLEIERNSRIWPRVVCRRARAQTRTLDRGQVRMGCRAIRPWWRRRGRPRWRGGVGRRCSATWGVLKARDRLSRASPTFSAASLICLQSPRTMRSIAVRTFFEMRFGGPRTAAVPARRERLMRVWPAYLVA